MNDTIYRKDAIDAVTEGLKGTFVENRDVAEKMLNKVPSAQPETCVYWDRESNICALHRPSAQPERPEQPESAKEYCAESF